MDVRSEDLLPGEKVLITKSANALVKITEYGLSRFFADDLLRLMGMKKIEGIGGKLYLTNYRLLFKSHAFNRLTGKFSVALPTIKSVKDTSRFVMKRIDVVTDTETFQFVVWGIPELISAIDRARAALTDVEIEQLRTSAAENYRRFGDGLKVANAIETMNRALLVARKSGTLAKIAAGASNPFELSGIMNLLELLGDGPPAQGSSTG
ncbi:uncharacterized protein EI97DRAFT_278736 [Westerdykella ornata]|uniref:GRAM domain-containing protein n=1 Tax=Westerdykella ornata TaxID=318751 RepID=A0A6A6JMV5_WESOR|nr:uncharacterized protein EI97DRAFT_278736 [Westerdykella ornata]KAF2277931.1 hypothetical protein EI97DRAFT_278736 [Westerdykella ornata]